MDEIGIFVVGDRELALRFENFPQSLHAKLKERIGHLTEELLGRVLAAVPRRTGKLAGEVISKLRDSDQRITGIVTLTGDYAKAAALEYGAHGVAHVAAHQMRLEHAWGRATGLPGTVSVPAYSRQLNLPARRFLRGPEAAMANEVRAELTAAIDQTVKQA